MSEHEHYFHNNGFEFDVCACGMSFVEHAITLESTVADLKEALAVAVEDGRQLAQAIRWTQEYCGDELLPPIKGWSWFDALNKHERALSDPRIQRVLKQTGEA